MAVWERLRRRLEDEEDEEEGGGVEEWMGEGGV